MSSGVGSYNNNTKNKRKRFNSLNNRGNGGSSKKRRFEEHTSNEDDDDDDDDRSEDGEDEEEEEEEEEENDDDGDQFNVNLSQNNGVRELNDDEDDESHQDTESDNSDEIIREREYDRGVFTSNRNRYDSDDEDYRRSDFVYSRDDDANTGTRLLRLTKKYNGVYVTDVNTLDDEAISRVDKKAVTTLDDYTGTPEDTTSHNYNKWIHNKSSCILCSYNTVESYKYHESFVEHTKRCIVRNTNLDGTNSIFTTSEQQQQQQQQQQHQHDTQISMDICMDINDGLVNTSENTSQIGIYNEMMNKLKCIDEWSKGVLFVMYPKIPNEVMEEITDVVVRSALRDYSGLDSTYKTLETFWNTTVADYYNKMIPLNIRYNKKNINSCLENQTTHLYKDLPYVTSSMIKEHFKNSRMSAISISDHIDNLYRLEREYLYHSGISMEDVSRVNQATGESFRRYDEKKLKTFLDIGKNFRDAIKTKSLISAEYFSSRNNGNSNNNNNTEKNETTKDIKSKKKINFLPNNEESTENTNNSKKIKSSKRVFT
jgi:hypothetical protein